jgi:hypothetical protein
MSVLRSSHDLNATHLDQQVFHAQCLLVILFSSSHRVDRCAQDLNSSIEVWPSRNELLCFLDVANDQFVICAIIGINLELLYLLQTGKFSRVLRYIIDSHHPYV